MVAFRPRRGLTPYCHKEGEEEKPSSSSNPADPRPEGLNVLLLTLDAISKLYLAEQARQESTVLLTNPMRFRVSWMTLSTLVKVAAFPTVEFFTANWSC